jgi:hypothetical protein
LFEVEQRERNGGFLSFFFFFFFRQFRRFRRKKRNSSNQQNSYLAARQRVRARGVELDAEHGPLVAHEVASLVGRERPAIVDVVDVDAAASSAIDDASGHFCACVCILTFFFQKRGLTPRRRRRGSSRSIASVFCSLRDLFLLVFFSSLSPSRSSPRPPIPST